MARPRKTRFVSVEPEVLYFKPRGVPLADLDEVRLEVEELEAIRLKDWVGLRQEECARRMKVSRPTFHRIYRNASRKMADFVIHGNALRITGICMVNARGFRCGICGFVWTNPAGNGRPSSCPECGSGKIASLHGLVGGDE